MEHRHFSRVPIDIKMLIYRRGLPVATGRIRNASRAGLFIETEYNDLHQYQRLECEFCVGDAEELQRHRVRAFVARRAREGVALELDEEDEIAIDAVDDLMFDSGASRRSGASRKKLSLG